MRSLLVIKNSGAGTSDDESIEAALEVWRGSTEVAEIEVCATAGPEELDDVLAGADGRTVVVAGGDGSLHAVVAALHRSGALAESTLALLPLGTGNDFARTLEIPLEPVEAAKVVIAGAPRKVDLLVDETGGIVVNHVHVGAGAEASKMGAVWKERLGSIGAGKVNLGKLGYPIGAIQAAVSSVPFKLRVEIDGKVVTTTDDPVLMVSLGNGTSVGGGAELTPDADASDGSIDVMVALPEGALATLAYAADVARGEHAERDDVVYLQGCEVKVSGEEFWASADGEIYGPETSRTWRLERHAYAILLP